VIGSRVTIWFAKAGHWFVCDGTTTVKAACVRFDDGATDYKEDGFRELEGGPRGVVRATLVELIPWTE
jgi:hypothetical protein